jgi:hypothetical protein
VESSAQQGLECDSQGGSYAWSGKVGWPPWNNGVKQDFNFILKVTVIQGRCHPERENRQSEKSGQMLP